MFLQTPIGEERDMHRNWIALVASVGVITAGVALASTARANSVDDAFLGALNGAGVNYADPGGTVALGQSICPTLARPGGTFASTASSIVGNNGMSPAMANMFTSIAISMYCPSMMDSLANGQMPNLPQLPGMPAGL
ncbi:MAG: DUF732 domain-containing protein [Mycobacterium sp.]